MIEWLVGLAVLSGYTLYKKYKSEKQVQQVLETIWDEIDA